MAFAHSICRLLHGLVIILAWPASLLAQPLAVTNEANSRLFSLNPDTGSSTLIGITGVPGLTDIARSADGSVFASTFGMLFHVNPATAAATPIGAFAPVSPDIVGLEFSASGELFGVSTSGGIFQINRTTGAATPLFTAGFAFEGDLAHESGTVFYATVAAGAGSRLVAIDVMSQSVVDRGAIAVGEDFPGLDFAADGRLLAFSRTGNVYSIPNYGTSATGMFVSSTSVPIAGVTLTPVPEPTAVALVAVFGAWFAKRRGAVS
jgi:hypothetical protein